MSLVVHALIYNIKAIEKGLKQWFLEALVNWNDFVERKMLK